MTTIRGFGSFRNRAGPHPPVVVPAPLRRPMGSTDSPMTTTAKLGVVLVGFVLLLSLATRDDEPTLEI